MGRVNKVPHRIAVILSESETRRFQEFCTRTGHKQSTLIRRLILDHLDSAGFYLQEEIGISQDRRVANV